jgi:hypothetical protein
VHFKFSLALGTISEVGPSQLNDFVPLLVHVNDSKIKHMFCPWFTPALTRELHSFLHHSAVSGFHQEGKQAEELGIRINGNWPVIGQQLIEVEANADALIDIYVKIAYSFFSDGNQTGLYSLCRFE